MKHQLVAEKHHLVKTHHHLVTSKHHLVSSTYHLVLVKQDLVSSKPINGMPQQVFELMKLVFVFGKRVDENGRSDFCKEFRVIDKAKHILFWIVPSIPQHTISPEKGN